MCTVPEKINVGYIGLGNIGKPSAKHLIGETFNAYFYDVYQPAVDELVQCGGIGCESPAEMAVACVHIGVCVRDEDQVESLLYGEYGLLNHARSGTIIAIHSTVTQAAILKWAADAEKKQVKLIDAPITGGSSGAEAASLCYMVGGDHQTVAKATPVFETSAEKVLHAGGLGTGIALKLCNNLITYAEFLAMSEAARLAQATGLSVDLLREVGKSNGVVNEQMHQFITHRSQLAKTCSEQQLEDIFAPFGLLGEKDLDCAIDSAKALGIELPATKQVRDVIFDVFVNRA
jgi:3-hydroxyisobutyrate dehydrogenase-like beta-hydroxyacid dehydrogenase